MNKEFKFLKKQSSDEGLSLETSALTSPVIYLIFQLLYYSAHYPTMFSLFSSLGLNKAAKSALRKIPYYASLIFIELLHDKATGKMIVQFSFKNGLEVSAL